jgi:predicted nucleic acid-binding protein
VSALVIDTSSWVTFFAGKSSFPVEDALAEGRVYLPSIVAGELLSGRLRPSERSQLEGFLAELPLCAVDLSHWFRVGQLRAELSERGISASIPDLHVAVCALDLKADLLTEDRIFRQVAKHRPLRLAAAATH